MSREYDYYNPLSSTYDPYTSAPYYQYLFTDPSGLSPQGPITSKKDAVGEQLAAGSTHIYDSLPPPPKKFGITTSESFADGSGPTTSSTIGTTPVDFNTIIIILLVAFVWFLLYRTGKILKCLKKLKRAMYAKGTPEKTGSRDDAEESFFE